MNGSELIAKERTRQIEEEAYTARHDAGHAEELAAAGAAYANPIEFHVIDPDKPSVPIGWPWDAEWWKPTPDDRIRELVKAGALIAAAIDSLLSESEG